MATWIAHMRVAEYFMKKYNELDNREFLAGNIGPDCGVPNEDWSEFTPNKNITHWKREETIDANDYKNNYLKEKDKRFPFYLGYYIHLLTDIEWEKFYKIKQKEKIYSDGLENDKNFIWVIKKDWYGQDHLYLKNNRESVFFKYFVKIEEFPNIYFNFYPEEAFTRQIKYISDFYLYFDENLDREFPFLSTEEMDSFVDNTIKFIENCGYIEELL